MQNLEETGPYIWLRYTTQFQKDGQTHTVELSVPVPVGASAERREQLIREAEAGMTQMVQHMNQKLPQILPRPAAPAQAVTTPHASPQQRAGQATQGMAPQAQPAASAAVKTATQRPAAVSAPQTAPQGQVQLREARSELGARAPVRSEEPDVPPTRPNIGASMPLTLGPTLDSSGNLPVPEFIKYIRENLNLDPREAMRLLNVKSLSTGINLRDALERLKIMVAQRNAAGPAPVKPDEATPPRPEARSSAPDPASSENSRPSQPTARSGIEEQETTRIIELRVPAPARGFDEELDEDEGAEDETLEDLPLPPDFSPQLLAEARSKINELREHQGASVASAKRLQALSNVIDTQITEEQLQELVSGVWGISPLKKLKVDQVEALISWAKEDDFIDEVEAALFLLEEEHYARGNR